MASEEGIRQAVLNVLRNAQPAALTADEVVGAVENQSESAAAGDVRDALRTLVDEDRIEKLDEDDAVRYRMS